VTPIPAGASYNVKVYAAPASGVFTWTAVPSSISGHITTISNPATDSNPSAVLLVTPVYNSTAVYDNHPIGVWYSAGHWTIFNQDLQNMPANASFNVVTAIGTGGSVFTQTATSCSCNWTTLNNSVLNGRPNAILITTPIYGGTAKYVNQNIGAWYDGAHWTIFHQRNSGSSATPMAAGEMFNAAVFGG
jgi:hypothetical protein